MKKSKFLFFLIITIFGLMFTIFAVMAKSSDTPTFEIDNASPTGGPVINVDLVVSPTVVDQNGDVTATVGVTDISGVDNVYLKLIDGNDNIVGQYALNDQGSNGDATANDGEYSGVFNIGSKSGGAYSLDVVMTDKLGHVNITRPSSGALTINGPAAFTCSTTADCYGAEKCCNSACVYDECTVDTDCVNCTSRDVNGNCLATENGTCDISGCSNVCFYSGTTACTSNADCVSPDNYCNLSNGTCLTAECLVDTDCTAQAGGSCNLTMVPPICEYTTPDTTPPTVNITEPLDVSVDPAQPFTTGTVIVKVTATDTQSAIAKVAYSDENGNLLGEQLVDRSSSGYPDEYWLTTAFSNGAHSVTATAFDAAGNTAQATVNLQFNLAGTAPIIDGFSTDKSNYTSSEAVQTTLSAHDTDSNINSVNIFSSKGGGAIFTNSYTQPSLTLTTAIGASSIVQLLNDAFDKYAVRQDNFKLPFIKVAEAATGTGNCTTTTINNNRYIYAMVADATNPATQSSNINLIITTTSTSCTNSNASTGGGSQTGGV